MTNQTCMTTDGKGVKLTIDEQAKSLQYIGQEGEFKKEVRRIMNSTDGKAFRAKFRS